MSSKRWICVGLSIERFSKRCWLGWFLLFLVGASYGSAPLASALEGGRIGVLYVGCIARSTPFWWMRSDPLFSFNFVQATLRDWAGWGPIQQATADSQVQRVIRLYMPRSVSDLTSRFDVVILSNANRLAVGPKNIEMIAEAVREHGVGLLMAGGWESFGGAFGRPDWGETSVGKLLPTEDVVNMWFLKPAGAMFLVFDRSDNEFIRSLPWDKKQPFMKNFEHNLVKVKPGAIKLAHVDSPAFEDHPAMVVWDWEGKGARIFALTGEIIGPGSEPGQIHTMCAHGNTWEYALDFGGNLMIYLDKRPVPQDVELVHRVRTSLFTISQKKSLVLALLEFCDSFGANTNKIMGTLDRADEKISEAMPDYLELRYEKVLQQCIEADRILEEAEKGAVKLKERALLWVYVIEWLAVTGTGMVGGFVVWSVMIRRKLYREVGTTKLITQDGDL